MCQTYPRSPSLYFLKIMKQLPLNLSETNQPVGIINFICYLFLFSFPSFGCLTVYTDQTYAYSSILIKVLRNIVEGKS